MVSFDVLYYKSKTKLTSAQHPARVHSCAAPRPPGWEESRVPPPGPLCVTAAPERPPRPLPSPARRETCRRPARGERKDTFGGMLLAGKIPERLSGKVLSAAVMRDASPGRLPFPGPRNGPPGSHRRPRAQAVSALPGRFCATAARRRWDAVISIHGRCIFFNATSLFQLVADSRIRFPMLFAFPVLWRIKIFVFIQSVPARVN